MSVRIAIVGKEFEKLIRGETVTTTGIDSDRPANDKEVTVNLCLADIGFDAMLLMLCNAMPSQPRMEVHNIIKSIIQLENESYE